MGLTGAHAKYPPPLSQIAAGARLLVAAGPGANPDEWNRAWLGVWYAWPAAATEDLHAELMTAGELRGLLATRDDEE